MPVLEALVSAIRAATVEVIDLTAKLDATTPVIRLPEPFGNTRPLSVRSPTPSRPWCPSDCGAG